MKSLNLVKNCFILCVILSLILMIFFEKSKVKSIKKEDHRNMVFKKDERKVCRSKNWITSQTNGETGNVMCIYAHLKYLQFKYKSKVAYISFILWIKEVKNLNEFYHLRFNTKMTKFWIPLDQIIINNRNWVIFLLWIVCISAKLFI